MNAKSTQTLDVGEITRQLSEGRLSRRGLVERLKDAGIGFGAAFVLGVTGAHAATAPDAAVTVKSANPAINNIIETAQQAPVAGISTAQEVAPYHRAFHRHFSRFYNRS
jgi:hypothetical protein